MWKIKRTPRKTLLSSKMKILKVCTLKNVSETFVWFLIICDSQMFKSQHFFSISLTQRVNILIMGYSVCINPIVIIGVREAHVVLDCAPIWLTGPPHKVSNWGQRMCPVPGTFSAHICGSTPPFVFAKGILKTLSKKGSLDYD